ncbi:MAG: DNA repair exonuclease [Oscillospiraceae bacterium]|nr:DNA repair exonuclease [Oscillospiraceae bacterium]
MIRILHAADLHLDSPFQALGRERSAQRRAEQRTLLERMAAIVREERVDMVLFAGDLFDSDNAFAETARLIEAVTAEMAVPVFIAPGNHDWYGPRSPWSGLRLGENVHVFTGEDIQCVPLPELNARIFGAAFTGHHRNPPLAGFRPPEKVPGVTDILVLHGEVGDPDSPYGAITESELAASGMDYAALGHIHSYSGPRLAGSTVYAWPGCPEGRGFDETGQKGVILAELEPGACRIEQLPMDGRRYELLSVDVTDRDPLAAVEEALCRDTARDIYRIRLTGETDQAPDRAALTRALEGRFFALELRDETRPRRDIWEGREQDSLRGLFLARLWAQYQAAPEGPERARISLAARFGLQALENGEEPPLP